MTGLQRASAISLSEDDVQDTLIQPFPTPTQVYAETTPQLTIGIIPSTINPHGSSFGDRDLSQTATAESAVIRLRSPEDGNLAIRESSEQTQAAAQTIQRIDRPVSSELSESLFNKAKAIALTRKENIDFFFFRYMMAANGKPASNSQQDLLIFNRVRQIIHLQEDYIMQTNPYWIRKTITDMERAVMCFHF